MLVITNSVSNKLNMLNMQYNDNLSFIYVSNLLLLHAARVAAESKQNYSLCPFNGTRPTAIINL